MISAVTLLSLFLSPLPQSPLKLPPMPEKAGVAAPVQRPLSEIERFRKDLMELTGSVPKIEQKLVEMGQSYPAIEALILDVARSARANEMGFLMQVARRYGTLKVADELKFQLLTRPLGEAVRATTETMAFLIEQGADPQTARQNAKQALRDCLRSRVSSARRPACEALVARASEEDLAFALQLSSEQVLDLQLRGVDLLRAVPVPEARDRLVALLSKEPALAAGACEALILLRDAAVPHLRKLLGEPAIDRGYCYAAFALAEIGDAAATPLLAEAYAPALLQHLAGREALSRSLAAVALADLSFYSDTNTAVVYRDVEVAEALLAVVDSRTFISNLDLLRRPSERRLIRLTGRVTVANEVLPWSEWWKAQRDGFVGIRAKVDVTEANAGTVVVALHQDRSVIRLLAEGLVDVSPLPGAQEILLTKEQMLALVASLQQGGFGDAETMRFPAGLPLTRSLQLQVRGARMQVAMPAIQHPGYEALVAKVQSQIDAELWQLYRNPTDEPDRAAFWRAERRWLDAHPDPVQRGQRLVHRIFANWVAFTPGLRVRALEYLFLRSDRRELLTEADGERILAIAKSAPVLGELELRLLELAAASPGDRVWRECVDHAARVEGGGRQAVRSVFAVLGSDAVLAALSDERAVVRRVAIDEAVLSRDQRAARRIVQMLADDDSEVRRSAAFACGQLQIASAAQPLIDAIVADGTAPILRRECLRALGRVGGDLAFPVLERSMSSTQQEDKEAALRGLGELRDPRAAFRLAEYAVVGNGKDLGQLASYYLQRLGGILAVPALRHQLALQQDPEIRAQLVLLLGGYQDVQVIPDLLDLLRKPAHAPAAAAMLTGSTGVDVQGAEDRIGVAEQWWRKNKTAPQWQWLLDGLKAADIPTVLRPELFSAGAGLQPVPELVRLLSECKEPRFCVLVSAVLRTVTNEDFGAVGLQTTPEVRQGIAARYRMLCEPQKAAQGR
ncbi:MAG: HEAT repeat domain-containing protein [Planctomycetes bacterium]|nr:HEAT repeat domain-containing protein [Planctomycetota bacterium]